MKYDIVIAHRVCPFLSKAAIGFRDKRSMVVATAASMAAALQGLTVRLVVILDGCQEYEPIFVDAFGASKSVDLEIIYTDEIGNQATWGKQLEILYSVSDSDFVYFSEDDYIYRTDAFRAMLDFIKTAAVDFVTPLDHPDRYNGRLEKPHASYVLVSEFCHWREVYSTCLTFLARANVVARCRSVMESFCHSPEEATMWLGLTKYGVFDFRALLKAGVRYFVLRRKCGFGELMALCTWKRQGIKLITKRRRRLFSPMPSLAVHLANCSLPPNSSVLLEGYLTCEELEKVKSAELATLRRV